MPSRFTSGRLVHLRTGPSGPEEVVQSFGSLDELFDACLHPENYAKLDRVELEGIDTEGRARVLTIELQAVSRDP